MRTINWQVIAKAKQAALEVLLHNAKGPHSGLPRTAAWGYPEPYTRDLMISILGIAVSGNQQLFDSMRSVLQALAENQSERGHISSLVHHPEDRGSSDTTPLFLIGVAVFRKMTGERDFLQEATLKALTWMEYQSPSDFYLVAQQPTSDWRDEQWVLGHGLFVNTLVYIYLRLLGQPERAEHLRHEMRHFNITEGNAHHHVHEGLVLRNKPYFALWSYKILSSERFDLLGNSLAILSGIASPSRAWEIISWIEDECKSMQRRGDLALDLPPNFFPFVKPEDPDWNWRYPEFNQPGTYHNGGIWPFVCGFYIAALVAAKKYELAAEKLMALTESIKLVNKANVNYGFNEWISAQDGQAMGQDWQTWSAAMYLYAAHCVEHKQTPFFEEMHAITAKEAATY